MIVHEVQRLVTQAMTLFIRRQNATKPKVVGDHSEALAMGATLENIEARKVAASNGTPTETETDAA